MPQKAIEAGLSYTMRIEISAHVFKFLPIHEEFFKPREIHTGKVPLIRKIDPKGQAFIYQKMNEDGTYSFHSSEEIEEYNIRAKCCKDQSKCSLNGFKGVVFLETEKHAWIRCKRQKLIFKINKKIIKYANHVKENS